MLVPTSQAAAQPAAGRSPGPVLGFYDGPSPPADVLTWFDEVVVDANIDDATLAALRKAGTAVLARVSRGSLARAKKPPSTVVAELLTRGFSGFLFDARVAAFAPTIETLVFEAQRRAPASRRYLWGRPERLPALGSALSGFVTDGIFTAGLPPEGQSQAPVMLHDLDGVRRLAELVEIQRGYRFPFIVLERVPLGQKEQARGIARTLAGRGFVPWVTVGNASLGTGLREAIPRRILAVYDGDEEADLASTQVHRLAALPLEHLGYALDYFDVRQGLPPADISGRYAGIVSWFGDDDMLAPRAYENWLAQQMDRGVRVAFMGRLGFAASPTFVARLGIVETSRKVASPVTITNAGQMAGFETRPLPLSRGLPNWRTRTGEAHIQIRDAQQHTVTPVVTGYWGGLAFDPYVIDPGHRSQKRWIIDPFVFFTLALGLEPIPAPDFTTENGRRLLFIHIDGDGFPSRAEMPGRAFSGEIIRRDFLEKYPFPTTVSIIEGETAKVGVYPDLSPDLEGIARGLFRIPNVEVASHSFSHPFDWIAAARGETGRLRDSTDLVYMAIPNYKYDPKREVDGSIRYINETLAPKDKPAKVFLWSGAAMPGPDALARSEALGLANMNGGNCELPLDQPVLAHVPSVGRYVDGMLHVYAQAQNENVYTNEWRGPFYGFRDVIRMFRFTEAPRRLKPINIYYHFYSGTKPAGITALDEVYQYALEQESHPTLVSEMTERIRGFLSAELARRIDGTWEMRNLGALRSLRLDRRLGWPDPARSQGVAGVREDAPGRFVNLASGSQVVLALGSDPPEEPHLLWANAALVSWSVDRHRVRFRLKGHVDVSLEIGGCSASGSARGGRIRRGSAPGTTRIDFRSRDTQEVSLSCR